MKPPLLPRPPGAFSTLLAFVGYALAATFFGLVLFAYLIGVELHLVSDRLAHEPERFAPLQLDEPTTREIRARTEAFSTARRAGKDMTVRIGNERINQWFALTTDPGPYRDRMRVHLNEDMVTVKLSLPMDGQGFPGRFLNGQVRLETAYDEHGLQLDVHEILLGDAPLSPRLMGMLRSALFVLRVLTPDDQHRKLRGLGRFHIHDSEFVAHSTQ